MYLYLFLTCGFYSLYTSLGSNEKYSKIFPYTSEIVTKEYRIVNHVKGITLGSIMPAISFVLYQCYTPPYIPNRGVLQIFGAIYASLDMSAMLYNPNCHTSTLLHHTLVQVLYSYCYLMDFDMLTLTKSITTYAIFSSSAYLVNYRLSIRMLDYIFENTIGYISLVIYFITSLINWGLQIYLLIYETPKSNISTKLLYLCLTGMIISDDIFLMKFLAKPLRQINNKEKSTE